MAEKFSSVYNKLELLVSVSLFSPSSVPGAADTPRLHHSRRSRPKIESAFFDMSSAIESVPILVGL